MTPQQLLKTLQLTDTFFPTGGFAYSDGLETAVTNGLVFDARSLHHWLGHFVNTVFVPCDGPAIRSAMNAYTRGDWEMLATLDAELTALKPAASLRASSAALGRAFLKSLAAIHPHPDFIRVERELRNFPVICAVAYCTLEFTLESALLSFAYTRLAGMCSASLRLMSIGQQEVQTVLTEALQQLPDAAERVMKAETSVPMTFAPILDIQQMNHRYVYSRLFRS